MKTTQYLTIHEVLELHAKTIRTHGGSPGARDMGLLESALYRAQSGYYETLSEQAAALLQSFCMNHPFIDGNKRVSLLVTVMFIRLNGYAFTASNAEMVSFILGDVIQKRIDLKSISLWLEKRMTLL